MEGESEKPGWETVEKEKTGGGREHTQLERRMAVQGGGGLDEDLVVLPVL